MNNISLDDIALFIRVINAGGFTACAKEIGLPKSSVSRRLAALERSLGVRLLERTTRRMHLTPDGERFYRYGQPLVTDLLQLPGLVQQKQDSLQGSLRVLMTKEYLSSLLRPVLKRYLNQHPGMSLDIDLHASVSGWPEDAFDLAITTSPLNEKSGQLRAEPITSLVYHLYAAPEYIKLHGALETPEQLASHSLLLQTSEPVLKLHRRQKSWQLEAGNGQQITQANDLGFLLEACRAGLGIAALPETFAERAVANQQLVPLLPAYRMEPRPLYAIYPERGYIDPRVQQLLLLLREHASELANQAAA